MNLTTKNKQKIMTPDTRGLDRITLGTTGLGGAWRPVNLEQSVEAIGYALEEGITHIDMAPAYMDAELVVGKALKHWKGQAPFLSTKIGKLRGSAEEQGLTDYRVSTITTSLNTSLERLNREAIDLLFLHEPCQIPLDQISTVIETILGFKEKGLVKKLGLGGKPPKELNSFIEQGYFDAVLDFNGFNLVEQKALQEDFPFYRKHQLEIYEGSPLNMGLLGRRLETYSKNPPSWMSLKKIEQALELQTLASKYNMSLPTMAHRYLLFSKEIDRMVIGPAVFSQLESTIKDIKMGPFEASLLKEIQKIIRK